MPDMGATKRCGDRDNPAETAPNIHMKIGIGITSALSFPGRALLFFLMVLYHVDLRL
jgi:hypothetical protein